jgi:hypothetical protein
MLSYLSSKFHQQPQPRSNEPRAALFLNRFTRTSTVMHATSGVREVLGIEPEALTGKSFYYCIEEECLQESVKCLESAKANDSIAYLRFRYRNPTQNPSRTHSVTMSDMSESDEDEDGGVPIPDSRSSASMRDSTTPQPNGGAHLIDGVHSSDSVPRLNGTGSSDAVPVETNGINGHLDLPHTDSNGRSSSDQSMDQEARVAREAIFDQPEGMVSRSISSNTTPEEIPEIELEAVISCTSDGLVVVLRRAHSPADDLLGEAGTAQRNQGFFATPWANAPTTPQHVNGQPTVSSMAFPSMPEPAEAGFMAAIRDVAVFAWSLTGINGSLAQYSKGKPRDEATPPGGLPIWDPTATSGTYEDYNGFSGSRHRPYLGMGEPRGERQIGQARDEDTSGDLSTSSDDEVVWKVRHSKSSILSPWKR